MRNEMEGTNYWNFKDQLYKKENSLFHQNKFWSLLKVTLHKKSKKRESWNKYKDKLKRYSPHQTNKKKLIKMQKLKDGGQKANQLKLWNIDRYWLRLSMIWKTNSISIFYMHYSKENKNYDNVILFKKLMTMLFTWSRV